MPNNHEILVEKAKKAITAVHSDTSVSMQQTFDSLDDLVDHARELAAAVESDLAREEGE